MEHTCVSDSELVGRHPVPFTLRRYTNGKSSWWIDRHLGWGAIPLIIGGIGLLIETAALLYFGFDRLGAGWPRMALCLVVIAAAFIPMISYNKFEVDEQGKSVIMVRRRLGRVDTLRGSLSECRLVVHPVCLSIGRAGLMRWEGFGLFIYLRQGRMAVSVQPTASDLAAGAASLRSCGILRPVEDGPPISATAIR